MKARTFLLFIAPSTLLLLATVMYPLGYSIWTSLHNVSLTGVAPRFVGLSNYSAVFGSRPFWISLSNTAYFIAFTLLLQFGIGFAAALMLNEITVLRQLFSVLIYIPLVIAPAAVGLFMKWMFIADYGLVNYLLGLVGLPTPAWLGDATFSMWSLILADAWQWTPFVTLVLLAALRSLPTEPIEAARVDGASALLIIRRVVLPALKPVVLFVLVIRSTNAIRMFDKVYVMTGGGPGRSTETLMYYNYRIAFGELSIGKASAVAVVSLLFLMLLAAVLIYLLFQRESDV